MGSKTDKRIVELDFDNAEFKKGVSETLQDMKKLDNAFAFKGTKNDLKDLDNSIKNVKVENLTQGVEKVKAEFSVMSAVAFSAIQKITGAVMDMGAQVLNSFTLKPITDGFEEYNLKMNSIKTIQTNTMGAFDNSDEQLKAINSTLSELNTYADKTIYNFAEMTRNIGTFTAAGVGLEESSQAIQGISNLAAASGSNAQQASTAMYQLSQALSSGTLKLMDWRSVINAGMGGQLFQNALIRTSEAMGTGAMDAIEKQGSFNESLQEGWATAEVLTKTLRNMTLATNEMTDSEIEAARAKLSTEGYTEEMIDEIFKEANAAQEAATKVKSFQQLVDTTQEALGSGWAQSWEYIIGDISEAEDLFTWMSESINGVISGFDDYRNGVLQEWHDKGGRDDIVASLKTFADIISKLVAPIQEAFGEIFKPLTGQDLLDASKNIRNFVEGINNSLDSENGQRFLQFIHDLSKGVFEAINVLMSVGSFSLDKITGFFSGLFNIGFNTAFGNDIPLVDSIKNFVESIKEAINSTGDIDTQKILDTFNKIKEIIGSLFTGDGIDIESLKNNFANLAGFLVAGSGVFLAITTFWDREKKTVTVTDSIKDALEELVDNLSIGKSIKRFAKVTSFIAILIGVSVALYSLASSINMLKDVDLADMVPKLAVLLVGVAALIGITKLLDKMKISFKSSISGAIGLILITSTLSTIAEAINKLNANTNGDWQQTLGQMMVLILGIVGVAGALLLVGRLGKKTLTSMLAIRTILDAFMGIAMAISLMSLVTGGDTKSSLEYMMVILVGIIGVATVLAVLSAMEKPIVKAGAAISGVVSAMTGISIAIGILSMANNGDPIKSLQQLGVIMAGIAGVGAVLIGLGRFGSKMISAAFSVNLIVQSMMGVALSIGLLSLANGGDAVKSIQQLGVIIVGLVAVGAVMIGIGKFGKHIISAALAVDMIVASMAGISMSIGLLSLANGGDAIQSIQQLGVIIVGLIAVSAVLIAIGKLGEKVIISAIAVDLIVASLIGIALSLSILSSSFGGDVGKMALTMLTLAGGLAALGLIMSILGKQSPAFIIGAAAITLLSVSLVGLSVAMGLLSQIPFLALIGSIVGLAAGIVAFGFISVILQPIIPVMLSFGASLAMLGISLNLIGVALFAFTAILTAAALLGVTAFSNLADGIVVFSEKIAASGDAIVEAGRVMGEGLAAAIDAFFGRIIVDIGNGITSMGIAIQGKGPEISNAARGLGSAIIQGLIGGLMGIGDAIKASIFDPITNALSGTDAGVEAGEAIANNISDNPEAYQSSGEQVVEQVEEGMTNPEAGTEAGQQLGDNYAQAAGEAANEKLPEMLNVEDMLAKSTENADTSGLTDTLTQMFGDALNPEEVYSNMGDFGGSISNMMGTGILEGASNFNLDPSTLLSNFGLTSGALDTQGMEVGKGLGQSISNGTLISFGDNSPIDQGINAQLDSINARSSEYSTAGQQSGEAYVNALGNALSEGSVSDSVSNNISNLMSGIDGANEAGRQTGQVYTTGLMESISSLGTLLSMAVRTQVYSASDSSDSLGAGNQTGVKFAEGSVSGIESQTPNIISMVASAFSRAASDSDPGGKGYQAGTWFGNGAQSGVSDSVGGMSGTVGTAFSNAASDSDPGGKGYQAGEWFARGMADGIRMYASTVADEAAKMVRDAKEAANKEQGAASPAKEMIKSGHWFDEGMMIGIKEYSSKVSDAAGSMTGDAMDSASSAFSLMGSLVDTIDWDSNPTITPVLDLDQFRSDAASMSGFMPDSQVVSASYAGRIDAIRGEALSAQNAANQNNNTIYITLDWKAGTTPNQMVQQIADGLQTLNLTKGR